MAYKDGEDFKTFCDKPYDKHDYKLIFKDGRSCIFDNYDIAKYYWYQWRDELETIVILDSKRRSGQGF